VTNALARPAGAARVWLGPEHLGYVDLVGFLASKNGPAIRAQVDPAVWWYASRASGVIAWALPGSSVIGGLLVATQCAKGAVRTSTQGLHEFIGALAVVFTSVHLASVLAADQLHIGLR
jgi:hypothetical protein